eukprot:169175_1
MSHSTNKSPTLLNPDFSGLWSVSWIGGKHNTNQNPSILNNCLSMIAISTVTMSWFFGFLSPLIILLLVYFQYYLSAICISTIILYPYTIKIKPLPAVSRFYVKYGCNYFEGGASMIYECPPNDLSIPLKSRVPSMVAYHPHGIFCMGFFYNSGIRLRSASDQSMETRQFFCGDIYGKDNIASKCTLNESKIPFVGLADSKLCKAPFFNHFAVKWTGCIESATGANVKQMMGNQRSLGLLPGGFYEVALFQYGKDFAYIKSKKGFIKYALRYGYQVIPAYSFGECKTYQNLLSYLATKYRLVDTIVRWLSKHNLPAVFFVGGYPWINPLLPYSKGVGIHTIHGKAIKIPKIENPTQDDIDKYHEVYCKELKALFDRNKFRFGMNDAELNMM